MLTDLLGLSVDQILEKAYRESKDKEVLYDGERRFTYGDLYDEIHALASGLSQIGIKKGDRVAVCLPSWYEFIVIVYAIAKLGAILVPFNTRFRQDEAEYILKDSGAKVAFFPREYDQVNHLAQMSAIKTRVNTLEHIITVRFEEEGLLSYNQLLQNGRGQKLQETEIDPREDLLAIIYTSGTTGRPKGTMLTHYSLVYCNVMRSIAVRMTSDDVVLQTSPFFHIMGLQAILTLAISQVKMVLLEQFKVERVFQMVEQEKVTVMGGVPTMFVLELNHPKFHEYDFSSVRLATMAGSMCPIEVVERVKAEFNCSVVVSYGMTETGPVLSITDLDDDPSIVAETVGKAIQGVELKVVDDDRNELPTGSIGELACRTPGLMKGYWHMPDKTKEVVDEEGWYYTGDLASIDEQGYVRIHGRKKDMVIRGGYNIYPKEIEDKFFMHDAVLDVAIVGLPDSVLGEVTCAAIILKEGYSTTPEELKEYIWDKVADYKRPDHIVIMDDFPRTHTGKVKKFELRNYILDNQLVTLR